MNVIDLTVMFFEREKAQNTEYWPHLNHQIQLSTDWFHTDIIVPPYQAETETVNQLKRYEETSRTWN